MNRTVARYLNVLAGGWLLLSAFFWPHSSLEWANTLVMGFIIMIVSSASAEMPKLRYLVTLSGAWLMVSALYLHVFSAGTRWNNFGVGLFVALFSVLGRQTRPVRRIRAV